MYVCMMRLERLLLSSACSFELPTQQTYIHAPKGKLPLQLLVPFKTAEKWVFVFLQDLKNIFFYYMCQPQDKTMEEDWPLKHPHKHITNCRHFPIQFALLKYNHRAVSIFLEYGVDVSYLFFCHLCCQFHMGKNIYRCRFKLVKWQFEEGQCRTGKLRAMKELNFPLPSCVYLSQLALVLHGSYWTKEKKQCCNGNESQITMLTWAPNYYQKTKEFLREPP